MAKRGMTIVQHIFLLFSIKNFRALLGLCRSTPFLFRPTNIRFKSLMFNIDIVYLYTETTKMINIILRFVCLRIHLWLSVKFWFYYTAFSMCTYCSSVWPRLARRYFSFKLENVLPSPYYLFLKPYLGNKHLG